MHYIHVCRWAEFEIQVKVFIGYFSPSIRGHIRGYILLSWRSSLNQWYQSQLFFWSKLLMNSSDIICFSHQNCMPIWHLLNCTEHFDFCVPSSLTMIVGIWNLAHLVKSLSTTFNYVYSSWKHLLQCNTIWAVHIKPKDL